MASSLRVFGVTGALAAALCWATVADASTVDITLSESGFGTFDCGTSCSSVTFGTFSQIGANSTYLGPPGISFDSNALEASSSTAGALTVTVTESGITGPTGSIPAIFSLTSNQLTSGWTILGSILGQAGFPSLTLSAIGTDVELGTLATGSAPYSLTEQFVINSNGIGTGNATIDLTSTPIPGTLPLFASGLAGFWAWTRKRRASAKQFAPPSLA